MPDDRGSHLPASYDLYRKTVLAGSADRLAAGLASLQDFGRSLGITPVNDPYFKNLADRVETTLGLIRSGRGTDLSATAVHQIRDIEAELEATLERLASFDQLVA